MDANESARLDARELHRIQRLNDAAAQLVDNGRELIEKAKDAATHYEARSLAGNGRCLLVAAVAVLDRL